MIGHAFCPCCGTAQLALLDEDAGTALLRVHHAPSGERCPTSLTEVPLSPARPCAAEARP